MRKGSRRRRLDAARAYRTCFRTFRATAAAAAETTIWRRRRARREGAELAISSWLRPARRRGSAGSAGAVSVGSVVVDKAPSHPVLGHQQKKHRQYDQDTTQ